MNNDLENPPPASYTIEDDDECVVGSIDDDDECVIEEMEDTEAPTTPLKRSVSQNAIDLINGSDSSIDDIINTGDHQHEIDSLVKDGIMNSIDGKQYVDDDEHHVGNDHVHDQLPSVEEVKTYQAYIPTAALLQKSNRRKVCMLFGGIMALIITITGIAFALKHNKHQKDQDDELVGFSPRNKKVIQLLYANQISSLPALKMRGTPEHYAMAFVSDGDILQLDYHTQYDEFVERYILALLYYATDGNNWTNGYNFMKGFHHCEWQQHKHTMAGDFVKGVQCDINNRVISLDLSGNNLVGSSIPREVKSLLLLQKLHLHHNKLGANIPDLSPLKSLTSVGLMEAGLQGTIPDFFGKMTQLTTLALSDNPFYKGTIPESFNNLKKMKTLGLDNIQLKGSIDPIKKLTQLKVVYLNDNALTGDLDGTNWNDLVEFDLSNNMVQGTIPSSIYQYPSLQVLDLHKNQFTGDFPNDIMPNDSLEFFAVHENHLGGIFSDRIGYLTNLKHLDVSSNNMKGTIPDTIEQLTNLISLSTSANNFDQQPLADYYSQMTNLGALSLKANNLTGTFPDHILKLTHLQVLDLDSNSLVGSIPTKIAMLSNLKGLLLNRNQFYGTIPTELGSLTKLDVLLLDGNNLYGSANPVCLAPRGMTMTHFITDCYPASDSEEPEVSCRCCTLCCNDGDPDCNNKKWTMNNDIIANYGDTKMDYNYNVDQAPPGWWGKAFDEATHPAGWSKEQEQQP